MNFAVKLLEISSYSTPIKNISYIPGKLSFLYKERNGFFAFEESLRIYSVNECFRFNNLFNNMLSCDAFFFGDSCLGDGFCLLDDEFFKYDFESGEFEPMGERIDEFCYNLLNSFNYYTGYEIYIDWMLNNRKLSCGEMLIPKLPFVLGGEYSIENLIAIDKESGFKIKISFQENIKNYLDGEKVSLEKVYSLKEFI